MDELNVAKPGSDLSEAKRQLLQKYLQGELTLQSAPARTVKPRAAPTPAQASFDQGKFPLARPIHLLFEDQVKRTPEAVAAVYETRHLTYSELNHKANQLAHYLRKLGVGPETLVGLAVDRSFEMLIGALGILKAGGAYVPLDPAFPRDRLRFMAEDAKLALFVTQRGIGEEFAGPDSISVKLDSDREVIARESVENVISDVAPENLAYVIYTSGSTGQPKGVQIPHLALSNFLSSMRQQPGLTTDDTLLSVTTLSFDIAGLELYLPLVCGARVVIASRESASDGRLLKELINNSGATVLQATPATWQMLIDAGWQGGEGLKALCGGEALSHDLANKLLERTRELWNMYGPTETTIWSSLSRIETNSNRITIGHAIARTQLYVLDERLNSVPPGVAGELYIGGAGLARGYLNRPELTAEKFIASGDSNQRIYQTGDLARLLADGTIEFLGRADNQVKLRGFRIELGEIEAVLTQHAEVAQAVVIVREDQPGDQRLVAYLITRDGAQVNANDLRRHLQQKLPDYMLPAAIVELESFPLTPNAKIDRKALPAPGPGRADSNLTLVSPRNETEAALARIWAQVLKLDEVSIHDNFFHLGGNSLLAGSMLTRVRDWLGVDLPMRSVFASPTVASLACEIAVSEKTPSAIRVARANAGQIKLSFPQERLWFLDQLNPGSAVFNIPLAARLFTPLDLTALEKGIAEIVRRHEVLRTTFATIEGRPMTVVLPKLDIDLPVIDLSGFSEPERKARASALINEEALRPFDLANGPLIRTSLIRLAEAEHIFLVTMHHIVSDGWSMVLFLNELSRLYESFSRGQPAPLESLPIQYADYAAWQRDWLKGEVLEQQVSYWKDQLGGELPILDFPTDRPRPAVQTFRGARKWLVLSETQTEAIHVLSRREGSTLFMTLLAAFKVLLQRYSGQEDIIVGSPISNRPLTESEQLIGFFLNNLALRTDLSGNPTFRDVVARVRQTALEAFANRDVPFEKLIEELRPQRDLSRTPLFQVYFNVFNFVEEIKLPGTDQTIPFIESWAQSEENFSKFDLTFYAGVHERKLKLAMVYNVDLFDEAFITRMLAHFETLIDGVVANPLKAIADISLGAEAGNHPPARVNRPANAYIEFAKCEIEQSIASRFEAQVRKHPAQIAVRTKEHQCSYQELNARANLIAHSILNSSVEDEERIGLLFEPGAPMIAAMLGALKAGKTYVPLDPNYPDQRLSYIIGHSQATALLTNNQNLALARRLTRAGVRLINIDRLDSITGEFELPGVAPDKLAYILYTSGSAGQPKGVMQNHRNVLHFIRVYTNNLHISSDDRLTLLSSYCFDASVMDIYGALLNGATLYPIDIRRDGLAGLSEQLRTDEITIYHSTPTVYRYFLDTLNGTLNGNQPRLPRLRLVVLGGEEVNRRDVELYQKYFSDRCLLVNGFGPTEATVSLQNFIDKRTRISGESVPVGFPVDDTEILLLDKTAKPTEIQGEIAIKSQHVALGYWRNSEATRTAFLSSAGSFSKLRIYRTGDLGRRLPDGSIRFEGRKDFQVKIRGFRVELGEIESVLNQHPLVRESVVVAREGDVRGKHLVAYVVPQSDQSSSEDSLRNLLKQKLPEYMLPAAFVVLQSLPLTASGKVDRRSLPAPADFKPQQAKTAAPQTGLEKLLLPIWTEVLGVEVSIHDNFFECGGHSLLAVRLFAQIEKRLGHRLPLATLFQAPTVAELAAVVEKDATHEWTSLVPIQASGDNPPFFCVHGLGGNVLEFYDLARHLGADQPFYGLQSQGLNGKQPLHTSVKAMAAHYIKEMRELQPRGPYFIGGRSLGGTIACEMACQLHAEGLEIGLLALLDTYPAGYAKLLPALALPETNFGRATNRIESHFRNLRRLGFGEKILYVIEKARYMPRKVKSFVWRRIYRSYRNINRTLPLLLVDIAEFNSMAAREYVPQVYPGQVTLFWASGDLRAYDLVEGWRVLAAGGTEVHEIPGNHLNIIKEPHVAVLAAKLSESLARAQGRQLRPTEVFAAATGGTSQEDFRPQGNYETNEDVNPRSAERRSSSPDRMQRVS